MPTEQRLSFTNSHGERLAGKLVDASSGAPVVILCHGYASTKDGFVFPALAAALAERGLSSLRFDFAGNGESEGRFSFGGYYREAEDLRAAVGFVRGELGRSVHAILGHSKGGNVVLLYAARYDDVPYVVNVAGRGVMARGIKERFGPDILERLAAEGAVEQSVRVDGGRTIAYTLTQQAVEERLRMDMFAEVARIAVSRVLTIHGDADTTIPIEDARALTAALNGRPRSGQDGDGQAGHAGGKRESGEQGGSGSEQVQENGRHGLVVVEGADHNFRRPPDGAERLIAAVVDYLVPPVDS